MKVVIYLTGFIRRLELNKNNLKNIFNDIDYESSSGETLNITYTEITDMFKGCNLTSYCVDI